MGAESKSIVNNSKVQWSPLGIDVAWSSFRWPLAESEVHDVASACDNSPVVDAPRHADCNCEEFGFGDGVQWARLRQEEEQLLMRASDVNVKLRSECGEFNTKLASGSESISPESVGLAVLEELRDKLESDDKDFRNA